VKAAISITRFRTLC